MGYDTQPFCSSRCSKITADCVGDEKFYPVNSTLYDHSTHPMKLCVPLFTPPEPFENASVGANRKFKAERSWRAVILSHPFPTVTSLVRHTGGSRVLS